MKFTILFCACLFCNFLAIGQAKTYKNEAGFQTDNDGFLGRGQDRYYTAGNFAYFNHALTLNDTINLANKVLGFTFGQKIYTAQSGQTTSPDRVDRPFAGYLYIGSSLNLLYKNQSNVKLEAQVGFVGPQAYGREIQDLIHKTFGFYTPDGWEYQIHNAFQINLLAQYNYLLFRIDNLDMALNSYANVGTGIIGAGGGAMLRFGTLAPMYNSITTASTVRANKSSQTEAFLYYKPMVNLVAYDATVQGNLFSTTQLPGEVTKTIEPVVLSEQFGGDLVMGHWVIDASAIFETRNVKEMIKSEQWGTLTVLYRFK